MRWLASGILWVLCSASVHAETVVAAHAIRARTILGSEDLVMVDTQIIGGFTSVFEIIGQEARVNLYAGRVIRISDIGPPAILERNQLVLMVYNLGLLSITAEGRTLARAGIGELVRVMNLDSRVTVTGLVLPDGTIEVRQ